MHVAVDDYIQRTRFDRMRIFRVEASRCPARRDAGGQQRGAGSRSRLRWPLWWKPRGDRRRRPRDRRDEARYERLGPDPLALSPDGARIAFHDSDRLRLVDAATGQERSRKLGYGGVIEWLDPRRVLFRKGGTALVLDVELREAPPLPVRAHVRRGAGRGPAVRNQPLPAEGARPRLGPEAGIAALTDRGIIDLVGVPEQPSIEPGKGGGGPSRRGLARPLFIRTALPSSDERTWTRSQTRLTSQTPWPPTWPAAGSSRPDQRLVDVAAVADLADEPVGLVPDPQHAGAVRVVQAVREDLVDRKTRSSARSPMPAAKPAGARASAPRGDRRP